MDENENKMGGQKIFGNSLLQSMKLFKQTATILAFERRSYWENSKNLDLYLPWAGVPILEPVEWVRK